jgi:hypothetical protein
MREGGFRVLVAMEVARLSRGRRGRGRRRSPQVAGNEVVRMRWRAG